MNCGAEFLRCTGKYHDASVLITIEKSDRIKLTAHIAQDILQVYLLIELIL